MTRLSLTKALKKQKTNIFSWKKILLKIKIVSTIKKIGRVTHFVENHIDEVINAVIDRKISD